MATSFSFLSGRQLTQLQRAESSRDGPLHNTDVAAVTVGKVYVVSTANVLPGLDCLLDQRQLGKLATEDVGCLRAKPVFENGCVQRTKVGRELEVAVLSVVQ